MDFLEDGRRVRLILPYAYIDSAALRWDAPRGAIVDGASIPSVLWSIVGGPFEGRYRNASILHDWYCDIRIRQWKAVHRMFHEAMLTSGVSRSRANLMYAAVYWGGPRWSETVVHNTAVAVAAHPSAREKRRRHSFPTKPDVFRVGFEDRDLDVLREFVSHRANADLDEIDAFVDAETKSAGS